MVKITAATTWAGMWISLWISYVDKWRGLGENFGGEPLRDHLACSLGGRMLPHSMSYRACSQDQKRACIPKSAVSPSGPFEGARLG